MTTAIATGIKVECDLAALTKAAERAARFAPRKSTLPVCEYIRLDARGGELVLEASDLTVAARFRVAADVTYPGAVCVPARLLAKTLKALPKTMARVELSVDGVSLSVADALVAGMKSDEFPPIPVVEGGAAVVLYQAALRSAIRDVAFAAAVDEARPVLTGVHTLLEDSTLTLAASDGHRLNVRRFDLDSAIGERTEIIVPARAMVELARLLTEPLEPVEMTVNEKRTHVAFRVPGAEVVAQLVPGTFPNYDHLIPHEFTTRVTVSAAAFLREVEAAAPYAKDSGGIVRLEIVRKVGGGGLRVMARAEEIGEYRGEIAAGIEGVPLGEATSTRIAFNYRYLAEALKALGDQDVTLETTTPQMPGVLRPVAGVDYVQVIMPMFVTW